MALKGASLSQCLSVVNPNLDRSSYCELSLLPTSTLATKHCGSSRPKGAGTTQKTMTRDREKRLQRVDWHSHKWVCVPGVYVSVLCSPSSRIITQKRAKRGLLPWQVPPFFDFGYSFYIWESSLTVTNPAPSSQLNHNFTYGQLISIDT